MVDFGEIEDAFLFVSSDRPFMNTAILNKNTGKIFYHSEMSGSDEFPDDFDGDEYIDIPHKNDLNLGRNLVFDFVSKFIPEKVDDVENIFHKKGAYQRYKTLLDSQNQLDNWYKFEEERTKDALLNWCKENELELSGETS